jgi:CHAT domain-containing protein
VLLARGDGEGAFHVLERSRAQAFLAQLAERDLAFGAALPAELEGERRRLASLYERTQHLLAASEGEQAEALASELRRLTGEHDALRAKIRAASPRFAALRYPQPLDVAGGRAALDPGTLLLAWSFGQAGGHLFVLDATSGLVVHRLGADGETLRREVESFRALVDDVRSRSPRQPALAAAGRRLYDLLLAPATDRIATAERLLLLPDGPLHLLPWAALPRPEVAGEDGAERAPAFLGAWKPLHLAVSATAYAELRRWRDEGVAPGGRGEAPARRLAVFADPAYRPGAAGDGAASLRGCRVEPLPATREEATAIAGLWGETAEVFLAADASEERVAAVAPRVAVLHLAAHGCLDERFPLNSAIALSPPAGGEAGDGLLQAWEVLEGLRLHADLVVLSACDTARGRELAGEGLLGLTRAFQYAGARSVVASLWEVPDRATAELMARFHGHLRAGDGKAEALRAAQAELAAGRAAEPYYWAGFQLYGDWR